MLHPFVIESLCEIVTGVGTTGLLSVFGGKHGHLGLDHEVLKLHSLNQISVPDVATVADSNIGDVLRVVVKCFAALLEVILSSEDGSVFLHGLLHVTSDLGS